MHLNQSEDVLAGGAQLQGQLLDFIFQHAVLVGDGFQFGWASKLVAGVFDVEGIHGRRL